MVRSVLRVCFAAYHVSEVRRVTSARRAHSIARSPTGTLLRAAAANRRRPAAAMGAPAAMLQ